MLLNGGVFPPANETLVSPTVFNAMVTPTVAAPGFLLPGAKDTHYALGWATGNLFGREVSSEINIS